MGIAGLQKQIPFAEIDIPKMGCFGPIVRFIDCRYTTASINKKNAKNANKIDKKRDLSSAIDRGFTVLLGFDSWESWGHYSGTSDKLTIGFAIGLEHCECTGKQEQNNDQASND